MSSSILHDKILSKLKSVKPDGKGRWKACCPAHDDKHPSLSITECDNGKILLHCHTGCETKSILTELGLQMSDLFIDSSQVKTSTNYHNNKITKPDIGKGYNMSVYKTAQEAISVYERTLGKCSITYQYKDRLGNLVGVIARWDYPDGNKKIRPVSHNGSGWILGGMTEPCPLYNLPDLDIAKRVYITEGEKAADAITGLRLSATTSAHGSNSTYKTDWTPLAGKEVIILPDNDKPGNKYAQEVQNILAELKPEPTIKVVTLPELPPSGDAYDFISIRRVYGQFDDETICTEIESLADAADVIKPDVPCYIPRPVLENMSDIEPEPIQWLWPDRIALGKLTLIAGDPGLGKSLISLDIAARISQAICWPDGAEMNYDAGNVLLLSAEDNPADTIRPRLDAAGADVSKIIILKATRRYNEDSKVNEDKHFSLVNDLSVLSEAIQKTSNCKLVIIDPVTAYLNGIDSHRNTDIRSVLAPLAELASKYNVAVIAVTHLNKNSNGSAMYRTMGSLAFTASARSVWYVTKDDVDPNRRLFLSVKCNISAEKTGLAYTVKSTPVTLAPHVSWEPEPIDRDINDILGNASDNESGGALTEAKEWLADFLSNGSIPASEIVKQAQDDGISKRTLLRAKQAIGVISERVGCGSGSHSVWKLSHTLPKDP